MPSAEIDLDSAERTLKLFLESYYEHRKRVGAGEYIGHDSDCDEDFLD